MWCCCPELSWTRNLVVLSEIYIETKYNWCPEHELDWIRLNQHLIASKIYRTRYKTEPSTKYAVEVVCDTFPGATTRAARGGLLIGETKALDAQARWTRWFMWFGLSEHNTLHPRRELLYCCVCCSSLGLNLPRRVCLFLSSIRPFIVQARIVTLWPKAR
jgi:hypothetical protein